MSAQPPGGPGGPPPSPPPPPGPPPGLTPGPSGITPPLPGPKPGTGKVVALILLVLVVAVVIALIVFLGGAGGEVGPPTTTPTPTPTTTPTPTPTTTPTTPVDPSLRDIVPVQVGPYVLETVVDLPELIDIGAVDALLTTYRTVTAEIVHELGLFATPGDAENLVIGFANFFVTERGFGVIDEGLLELQDGGTLRFAHLSSPDGTEVFVWSNGRLFATVIGPPDDTFAFWLELPY